MSEAPEVRSVVPLIRLRDAGALVARIGDLKDDARRQGYETLAYFLEIAEREAKIQADRHSEAIAMKRANPDEIWQPTRDDAG